LKCPNCGVICARTDEACDFCGTDLTGAPPTGAEAVSGAAGTAPAKAKSGELPGWLAGAGEAAEGAAPGAGAVPAAQPRPPSGVRRAVTKVAPEHFDAQAAAAQAPAEGAEAAASAELPPGMKACAGCGRAEDASAMKLIGGRPYCWGCEMAIASRAGEVISEARAATGDAAPDSVPPGMMLCSGCKHPKKPEQLKEISGGQFCVNCERKLVEAFRADVLGGGAQAAGGAPAGAASAPGGAGAQAAEAGPGARKQPTRAYVPEEKHLSEEESRQREERKRLYADEQRRERDKRLARRVRSKLTEWPEVTVPPQLLPPPDPAAARERPAPEIPEKRFRNSGATRWVWMGIVVVLALIAVGSYFAHIGGGFPAIIAGFGILVSLYLILDTVGGLRVDTRGVHRDSLVGGKRIFWSMMKSVEIIQEDAPGLGFLRKFYTRLYFLFTTGDGRKTAVHVGAMGARACVEDFDGLKKHLRIGAIANAVKVIEKAEEPEPAAPPQESDQG